MSYMIRPIKNRRFVVLEKLPGKKGFGSVVIRANVGTRSEAVEWVKENK